MPVFLQIGLQFCFRFYGSFTGGYLQSNFFRLMVAITEDEPDVEEIERIILELLEGWKERREADGLSD